MHQRGRSLEEDRARLTGTGFTGTGLAPPGPSGRARGRDGGRILVTVVSTSRLPVVVQMSRARWPSSPTARSCDCLHRGSNAQAVSKTGGARLLFCWRRASTCRWRAQVVSRGGWRASRRARKLWGRRGSGRRARVHLQHVRRACAPARSGRAYRKLRALHALLPAGPGGTPACEGLARRGW